ncbi:MAG TPA: YceI family protein [Myxococcales bacterium]|jgi:polyisoprenoid-binding protein YceI
MMRLIGFASAVLLSVPVQALAADYDIDSAHSQVGFAVKHLMVSTVKGEFGKVSGTVSYDPKKPEATVLDVTIDTTSINTREAKRDGHLKSPDFFDTEKFATATFKSTKVQSAGKGKLKVTGDLTIKGITKPVTLEVTGPSAEAKSPWGQTVIAASAIGKVSRRDFGMTWNKTLDGGGLLVGENVDLSIDAELIKKEPAPEAKK